MPQKKETNETKKPGVKVQDLAPKKDAKGGVGKLQPKTIASAPTGAKGGQAY